MTDTTTAPAAPPTADGQADAAPADLAGLTPADGADPGADPNSGTDGAEELGDAGKKALDAMREERNAVRAELADVRARLREYEDRDKTEAQRLQEATEDALGRAARAEHELWRERAARRHGLDDELVGYLHGETEDELDTAAKTLAAKITAGAEQRRRGPRPDPTRGREPASSGGTVEQQFAAAMSPLLDT